MGREVVEKLHARSAHSRSAGLFFPTVSIFTYTQDNHDVIQQDFLWNLFPQVSPLHLNLEISPGIMFISTSDMSSFRGLSPAFRGAPLSSYLFSD